jgi:hypothetical protein
LKSTSMFSLLSNVVTPLLDRAEIPTTINCWGDLLSSIIELKRINKTLGQEAGIKATHTLS